MAGLGFPELLIICVIALFVFGPKKLPDAGKALGQAIRGFRASMDGRDEGRTGTKAAEAHPSCPGCGRPVEAGAAFCAQCGRALAASQGSQSA